jgi:uncharacterized protein (DUF1697 family)
MPLFAAFLRGMNVGGHRLTNEELRTHFEAIGLEGVRTFRASGNVVFSAEVAAEDTLARRIEAGLERALGYAVPTYIRSASEMLELAASRPFDEQLVRASSGKLQVALLTSKPSASARRQVQALSGDGDLLAFGARELFWLPSAGVLDSTLDMKTIERLLGSMTMRTKNTIEQIAERHFAREPG